MIEAATVAGNRIKATDFVTRATLRVDIPRGSRLNVNNGFTQS